MPFEKGAFGVVRDPGNPKYEESRLKGFRVRWAVSCDYEVREDILIPKAGANLRDYYPVNHPAIPIQLAKIQTDDTKALLAFARKYGHLGFLHILPFTLGSVFSRKLRTVDDNLRDKGFWPGETSKERARLAHKNVADEAQRLRKLSLECDLREMSMWEAWIRSGGGDPLPWVWAHVRTLNLCIAVGDYIANDDEEGLTYFFQKYPWKHPGAWRQRQPGLEIALQHKVITQYWSVEKDWTSIEFGKYLRREIINENIRSIRIAIQPDGNQERSFFQSRSLIEMAYWHLQNHVIAGTIKRCEREGCGAFFVKRHGRERFCPTPTTGPKNESRCAVLHRVLKSKALTAAAAKQPKRKLKSRR